MQVKISWCLALWTLEWSHLVDSGAITSPLPSRPLWQCSIMYFRKYFYTSSDREQHARVYAPDRCLFQQKNVFRNFLL